MERTSDGRVERGESVAWQTEEVVPVGTSWNPVGVINGTSTQIVPTGVSEVARAIIPIGTLKLEHEIIPPGLSHGPDRCNVVIVPTGFLFCF